MAHSVIKDGYPVYFAVVEDPLDDEPIDLEEMAERIRIKEKYELLAKRGGYDNVGYIYQSQRKLEAGLESYEKSLKLRKELAEETRSLQTYDDSAVSYYKLSFLYKNSRKLNYLQNAANIWAQLCAASPGNAEIQLRLSIDEKLLKENS